MAIARLVLSAPFGIFVAGFDGFRFGVLQKEEHILFNQL